MQFPTPYLDEHSKGYLGRTKRLNGNSSLKIMRRQMIEFLPGLEKDKEGKSWVQLLALASRLGLKRFIAEHTLMPFLRTVHSDTAGYAHGTNSSNEQLRNVGVSLGGPKARFCAQCSELDRKGLGVSYWRRSHQLPGAVVCSMHGCTLLETDTDAPGAGTPTDFEEISTPVPHDVASHFLKSPVIRRYIEICDRFLKTETPIDAIGAATSIAKRASNLGLRISAIGQRDNLSDLALAGVDGPWAREFFPSLTSKMPGQFVAQIDGTCLSKHSSYHSSSYALALAVLWDSAEDALADFRKPYIVKVHSEDRCDQQHCSSLATLPMHSFTSDRPSKLIAVELALRAFFTGDPISKASTDFQIDPGDLENALRRALKGISNTDSARKDLVLGVQ